MNNPIVGIVDLISWPQNAGKVYEVVSDRHANMAVELVADGDLNVWGKRKSIDRVAAALASGEVAATQRNWRPIDRKDDRGAVNRDRLMRRADCQIGDPAYKPTANGMLKLGANLTTVKLIMRSKIIEHSGAGAWRLTAETGSGSSRRTDASISAYEPRQKAGLPVAIS